MTMRPRICFFSPDEGELLREKVFDLLERHGVKMDHPEVTRILGKAGAKVDSDTHTVRFPKDFLKEYIALAPRELELVGKNGQHKLQLPRPDGTFYTRTNTGAQSWIEPETGVYRRVTIPDVAIWARLVDMLSEIDFAAFPVPEDVPQGAADVHALNTMLQHIQKHVWVQPYTDESVGYLVKLSLAAAGGEEAIMSASPVSFITCSLTPFDFTHMDLEIILQCARYGIPLHPCSLPGAGATAPITEPGVVVLTTAELLSMLVTAQVIQPGTPIISTPLIFSTDMRTGRSLQSSAESVRANALCVQLLKRVFGVPTHTYGIGSDSPIMDGQCMSEGALRCMLIALSGADILGAAGQLEVATTISPVQLVIDNEVFGVVRRILTKMAFNVESMAWDDLMTIAPGAQFLTTKHTLDHCRDGLPPINFIQSKRDSWEEKKEHDLVARATEFYRNLMGRAEELPVLSEDVVRDMDAIVEHADAHLGA